LVIDELEFMGQGTSSKGGKLEMTPEELKARTKAFGLRILKLVAALPSSAPARAIGNQILRSGTSVGGNYRAACRARSKADFASKLAIAGEEADETFYWLELLAESGLIKPDRLTELQQEAYELVAIITASRKTAEHGREPV
jgi:four helix bundle protein